jgi:transposase-like protein
MKREQLTEQWRERLAGYTPELGTVSDWCKANGLSLNQYYYWRRRLQPTSAEPASSGCDWVSLSAVSDSSAKRALPSSSSSGVAIRIGAATIDIAAGFDADVLRSVMWVLREAKC